jgi:hypothetical protein
VIGGDATAAGKAVPEVFTSVLQEAAMKAGLAGDKGLLRVNALHSREVFRATIRSMSNGSAPGGSGISYAELKCMSDDILNLLSDLCNVSVAAGLPPTEWCKEIVYMILKEAGVDDIEKQRPLKLQESLKKVTVWSFGRIGWLGCGSGLECVTSVSLPFFGDGLLYNRR